MWQPRTIERPSDPHATEIVVTLAESGPRYVSADAEFAVWTATLGEESDGEPVTLTGAARPRRPRASSSLCAGAFSEQPKHGWQFAVETFRSALPQTAEGIVLWLTAPRAGDRADVRARDRQPLRRRAASSPSSTATRSGCARCGRGRARRSRARAIERAIEAWREVATIREVEAFLFAHGIGAGPRGAARPPLRRRR